MHTKSLKQSIQLVVVLFTLLIAGNGNMRGQTNISYAVVNPSFEDANLITTHRSAWGQVGQTYANCTGWTTFQYCEQTIGKDDAIFIQSVSPNKSLGIPKISYATFGIDGDYVGYYEAPNTWSYDGFRGIKQHIKNLPAGTYTISAIMGAPKTSEVSGTQWWLKLGIAIEANMHTGTTDSNAYDNSTIYDERPVSSDYVGEMRSVTFTLPTTSSVTLLAGIHSGENRPEDIRFWIDNVQLFSYGTGATCSFDYDNASFENSYKVPVTATDANKNYVPGWEVTSTDKEYVYFGVIGNTTSNYSNYSKLQNVSAQSGSKVLLVRHGEKNDANTFTYSSIGTAGSYPTDKGFAQQATITLKTTAHGLEPGNYLCKAKVKLSDYGGAHARVGIAANPEHGTGGDSGLSWNKTTWHNMHIWQERHTWIAGGNKYGVYKGYWDYNLNGNTGEKGDAKQWEDIFVHFEVSQTGNVEIVLTLDFPADDSYKREMYNNSTWNTLTGYAYLYGTEALIDNITISTLTPWTAPGDYYLYNEETGMYLSTHAGAAWGSQAMCDEAGMEVALTTKSDGTGYIDTKIAGASGQCLFVTGSDVYNDGATSNLFTLQSAGSGSLFYLSQNDKFLTAQANGVMTARDIATDASKWRLKTYAQRVRELQDMAPGDSPMDATFLIQNPGFGRYDLRWSKWKTYADGTELTYGENNQGIQTGVSDYRRGGNVDNYFVENWHHSPNVYQTLPSRVCDIPLPSGVYTLTAQGFDGEGGSTSQLYIKDENNADVSNETIDFAGNTTFSRNGYGTISDWFKNNPDNGKMEIEAYIFGNSATTAQEKGAGYNYPAQFTVGVQNAGTDQWTVFDNFQLRYRPFNSTDVTAETDQMATLETNIVNKGTAAFKVNTSTEPHLVALNDVVSAASGGVTKEDFRDNVLALKRAQIAFKDALPYLVVNEPDISKYYNIKNVSDSYSKENKVLTFKANKSPELINATTMSWSEDEGSIYPQTVSFVKVPDVDCTSKVSTAQASWTGSGGTCTIGGVGMVELYGSSSAGIKMSQEVTGLDAGLYRVELYATSHNARGEDGALLNGARSGIAYVFATSNGVTKKTYFTARGIEPGGVAGEPETPVVQDIEVGPDGKMTLGLGLESSNLTGWHAIQIKSLVKIAPNDYTLRYTRADGTTVYVGTGTKTGLGSTYQLCPTTVPGNALKVTVDSQGRNQDDMWWLKNTECSARRIGAASDNENFSTETTIDQGFYDVCLYEAIAKPSASVSVSDVYKFSTLMLPFDAELPEGVTAYTVKGTLSDKTIALQTVGRNVQANVPYVIYAENGLSATTLSGFGKAYTDDTQNDEQLTGTFFGQEDGRDIYVPKDCYVLSVKNYSGENRVAFYRVTEENTVRLPKYRAYYTHKDFAAVAPSPAPARASAYGFTILDDNKTPADIITLVNIILRKDNKESAPRFVQRADGKVVYTDINGDGEVTLADVTALVNMMHEK